MEGAEDADHQGTERQRDEILIHPHLDRMSAEEIEPQPEIESSPEEIDQGRGIADASWFRKRRGKWDSLQSARQMGNAIAKKSSG